MRALHGLSGHGFSVPDCSILVAGYAPSVLIDQGDATVGVPWPAGSVQAIVTSPPYWGLRSYGDSDVELGRSGESLVDYLERLCVAFDHCREALDDEGLLWVNIFDTASKSGGAGGDYNRSGSKAGRARWKQGESGFPRMTWCNVPGSFASKMMERGWLLRAEIVWNKERQRAESLAHVRRTRPQHEWIFMFAKGPKHRFYPDGLVESGSVWTFPPESSGAKGQAPFPEELPRRCIACSTVPGMTVADPFAGSGTTPRVAESMGRVGVGLDLYAGGLFDTSLGVTGG